MLPTIYTIYNDTKEYACQFIHQHIFFIAKALIFDSMSPKAMR